MKLVYFSLYNDLDASKLKKNLQFLKFKQKILQKNFKYKGNRCQKKLFI